jgi:hypothetical protein
VLDANRRTPPCPSDYQAGDEDHPNSPYFREPPDDDEPGAPEWVWDDDYLTPDGLDTTIRIDDDGEVEVTSEIQNEFSEWRTVEVKIPVEAMLELLRKSGKL